MSAVRGLINAAEVGSDGEIRLPDEIRLPTCSVRTVVSGIQKKVCKVLDPTKEVREVRNWTKDETELFCNVVADPINNFVATLEKKALKKASTKEVFEDILS